MGAKPLSRLDRTGRTADTICMPACMTCSSTGVNDWTAAVMDGSTAAMVDPSSVPNCASTGAICAMRAEICSPKVRTNPNGDTRPFIAPASCMTMSTLPPAFVNAWKNCCTAFHTDCATCPICLNALPTVDVSVAPNAPPAAPT